MREGDRITIGDYALQVSIPSSHTGAEARPESSLSMARGMVRDLLERLGPGESQPSLRVLDGPQTGVMLTLGDVGRTYILGRAAGNDLRLDDVDMWREHAALVRDELGVTMRARPARTRVTVNGERVAAARQLHDGDTVTLGATSMRYHDPAEVYLRKLEAEPSAPRSRSPTVAADRGVAAAGDGADRRSACWRRCRRSAASSTCSCGEDPVAAASRSRARRSSADGRAAAVVCHPHPAFGGRMDTPLVVALADALRRAPAVDAALQLSRPRRLRGHAHRRRRRARGRRRRRRLGARAGRAARGAGRLLVRRAHGGARPRRRRRRRRLRRGRLPDDASSATIPIASPTSSARSIAACPGSSSTATPTSSARSPAAGLGGRAILGAAASVLPGRGHFFAGADEADVCARVAARSCRRPHARR